MFILDSHLAWWNPQTPLSAENAMHSMTELCVSEFLSLSIHEQLFSVASRSKASILQINVHMALMRLSSTLQLPTQEPRTNTM